MNLLRVRSPELQEKIALWILQTKERYTLVEIKAIRDLFHVA